MKIAVVDDDKAICEAIAQLIKNQESEAEVCQFSSGKEMLETGENFAISFLDIAMEEMSGLELAGKLRQEQERKGWVKSILIFITGYREYMEEAFDVNAFHYLVKPIDEEKFSKVFRRAWKEVSALEEQSKKYIVIKNSGTQQKIYLKDIYNDGVQDGMEQGRRSGIAEGEAHGKELGIASQKKEVALQMQKLGYPLDAIAAVLMESLDSVLKILAVVG